MASDVQLADEQLWALAYGHVLQARRRMLDAAVDPLGDHCFANAVLLDAENGFELLGVTPAVVPPQHSPSFSVESALALLKAVADTTEAHRLRKILLPFRSESWEA